MTAEQRPLCPLRSWAPCAGVLCAWYDGEYKQCALHSIAVSLNVLAERGL